MFLLLCGIILLWEVESNPNPNNSKYCNLCFNNICGLYRNLIEIAIILTKFNIICCAETLITDMSDTSELLLPNFEKLCCYVVLCLEPKVYVYILSLVLMQFVL